MFDWIEGSRAFDVTWGLAAGAVCLAVASPLLYWVLPATRRSAFGMRLDPHGRLQLAYGIFGMSLAFTNVGCRLIDHGPLEAVHPTFFVLTVVYCTALAPRVVWMLAHPRAPRTA